MPVIRKTVAIDEIIDKSIRAVWAQLIRQGQDASYSTALNFLIIAAIMEMSKPGGFSEETWRVLRNFIEDHKTIEEINLEDFLANLEAKLMGFAKKR